MEQERVTRGCGMSWKSDACEEDVESDLNALLKTVQVIALHRDLICQEDRFY